MHTIPLPAPSVECTPLKRAIEASYAAVLPKACKPFLFLVRWLWWRYASGWVRDALGRRAQQCMPC